MPHAAPIFRTKTNAGKVSREPDRRSSAKRGYGYRWQKERQVFLAANPWCVECDHVATVVDHVLPHRGDVGLFWDAGNWQAMCKACHDRKTARGG